MLVTVQISASGTTTASLLTASGTAYIDTNWAAYSIGTHPRLTLGATDATVVGVFLGIDTLATTVGQTWWTRLFRCEGCAKSTEC